MKHLAGLSGKRTELSLLFEISQILDSSLDLRTVVEPVLEALTRSLGMKFATLTLLNRQTGEIGIESAYGLSPSQKLQAGGRDHQQGHPDRQGLHRAEDLRRAAVPGQDGGPSNAGWEGHVLHLRAHQDGPGGGRCVERGSAGCGPFLPAGRGLRPLPWGSPSASWDFAFTRTRSTPGRSKRTSAEGAHAGAPARLRGRPRAPA